MLRQTLCLLAGLCLLTTSSLADVSTHHEAMDALFSAYSDPSQPGMAVGVFHDGKIVYAKGFGSANIEHDVPITPDTVFYLGSVGKQFTAFAIALLQKDGKLDVDDDIRKYLPEMPDYGETITIRDLLHHTSGIRDYLGLAWLADQDFGSYHHNQPVVDLIARQKALNFPPGEQYLYSNSGYFLLAVIVERASGQTLREFADERMFGPLGMANSHFHDDHTHPIRGRAMSYLPGDDGELDVFLSSFDRVGSGGVYGSVNDLLKWDNNFYSHEVGGQAVNEWMHQQGVLDDGTELDYAWGIIMGEHRGLRTVSHGGSLGGYRTALTQYPDQKFTVAILANVATAPTANLASQVAEIYLSEAMAPVETAEAAPVEGDTPEPTWAEIAPAVLEAHTGLYYSEEFGLVRRIEVENGQLQYSRGSWPGANSPLGAKSDNEYTMIGTPITVFFDPDTRQMRGVSEGTPDYVFERIDVQSSDALAEFTGRFHSVELDLTVRLEAGEEGLVVRYASNPDDPVVFNLAKDDTFVNIDIGAVRYRRGEDGLPAGFKLDAGRVMGIEFERLAE